MKSFLIFYIKLQKTTHSRHKLHVYIHSKNSHILQKHNFQKFKSQRPFQNTIL